MEKKKCKIEIFCMAILSQIQLLLCINMYQQDSFGQSVRLCLLNLLEEEMFEIRKING